MRKLPAVLIAMAGVAVGVASPAGAQELNGTYIYTNNNGSTEWAITSCGEGCANVSVTPIDPWKPYRGQATLANDQWTMTIERADGLRCGDDMSTTVPLTTTFTWSATTMSGSDTTTLDDDGCDFAAGKTWINNFTLTKA